MRENNFLITHNISQDTKYCTIEFSYDVSSTPFPFVMYANNTDLKMRAAEI